MIEKGVKDNQGFVMGHVPLLISRLCLTGSPPENLSVITLKGPGNGGASSTIPFPSLAVLFLELYYSLTFKPSLSSGP
jgi:hypothetical protein